MKTDKEKSRIGVIGGSGFTGILDSYEEIRVNTPYGAPSANPIIGKIGDQEVVFLPRHGLKHEYPPHKVPYRANIYALKELGVNRIITCAAVGSIKNKIKPGDFVILDQFVNWTKNRTDTYFDGPITTHISTAFPYCPQISSIAKKVLVKKGIKHHSKGTVVVIEGPRFSTAAESLFFGKMGWDVVNMTQYPEVALAREMGMCYCALALVTDFDAGVVIKSKIKPVTMEEVLHVFNENNQKAVRTTVDMIKSLPQKSTCNCHKILEDAQI